MKEGGGKHESDDDARRIARTVFFFEREKCEHKKESDRRTFRFGDRQVRRRERGGREGGKDIVNSELSRRGMRDTSVRETKTRRDSSRLA